MILDPDDLANEWKLIWGIAEAQNTEGAWRRASLDLSTIQRLLYRMEAPRAYRAAAGDLYYLAMTREMMAREERNL
jgi:hypothetical protein